MENHFTYFLIDFDCVVQWLIQMGEKNTKYNTKHKQSANVQWMCANGSSQLSTVIVKPTHETVR